MENHLQKSQDRMISGVCGGIAEYFALDATLVRLLFVVLALASGGGFAIVYVVLMLVIPEKKAPAVETQPDEEAALPQQADSTAPAETMEQTTGDLSEPAKPRRTRGRGDSRLLGWALLALGVYFFLRQFGLGDVIGNLWPILIIVVGVVLLWPYFRNR